MFHSFILARIIQLSSQNEGTASIFAYFVGCAFAHLTEIQKAKCLQQLVLLGFMGSQECVRVYLELLRCSVRVTDELKFHVGQMYPIFAEDSAAAGLIEQFAQKDRHCAGHR